MTVPGRITASKPRGGPSLMTALGVVLVALLATLIGPSPSFGSDPVSGTWGAVADGSGKPKCQGTAVLVFHEGRYFKILPDVTSTGGSNQLILAQSTYRLIGDRLEVAQPLSLTNPEPRRTYLVPRIGEPTLILQGKERVTFKPCPTIDPAGLDRVVK